MRRRVDKSLGIYFEHRLIQELVRVKRDKADTVLVIGAGITGINAALKLADSGAKVYHCEREPHIGGTLVQLDKWFPDNHCGLCQDLPTFDRDNSSQYCLRQGLFHPNITIMLNSEVEHVEGEAGNFSVRVKIKSTGVREDLCTGCGLCEQVCPIESAEEFIQGLGKHKAIYLSNLLSLSKIYTVDKKSCTKCGICLEKCPARAIDLNMPDKICQIEADSIILSTGFEEFDPLPATEFGYKRYPNVITSLELERWLSGTGPSGGILTRPSDGKVPGSIAFIQCVGSRTRERDYCSSTCCMYAIKEAMMLKEAHPETDVTIHYMDIRDFGKGYYRYYQRAKETYGIKFTRCRVPTVKQDFRTKDLLITSMDEDNKIITNRFDTVVLSVGQTPSRDFTELCRRLAITTNEWGFCVPASLNPVATERRGIYVCGSASSPKGIADTLTESTAAACQATALNFDLKPAPIEMTLPNSDEPKVAVFICNCMHELSEVLDLQELASLSKSLPGVVHVEEVSSLCYQETLGEVKNILNESSANRAIMVACSRLRTGEFLAQFPVETVNIREQLAWVHKNEGNAATAKAKKLILMAWENLSGREDAPTHFESVTPRALVVGGGLAGLTAALAIAQKGLEVELVEKSSQLGGNARNVYSSLGGENPSKYIRQLIDSVKANSLIHLRIESEMVRLSGYAGNFKGTLRDKSAGTIDLEAGAIIVATGAEGYETDEYLLGKSERVITQQELAERLFSKSIDPGQIKSVAMIQCVGSRDNERPYCSRICCTQALKNALLLKQHNPEMDVSIFYRDLMSYGLKEEHYTLAREKGIMFFRYSLEKKPEVTLEDKKLTLRAVEPVLGESMVIEPDFLVLSTAIIPSGNDILAKVLDVELDDDGFFKEAGVNFRPVDLSKQGLYVCGMAHSPRDIAETITQAQAAAQRAVFLLSQRRLTSGQIISVVNERRCRGCELCIKDCPYHARVKDSEKGVAQVLEHLCQGCGTCVSACPSGAASLREFQPKQILSMVDAAL